MSIPSERREQVRKRAGLACEYCGVTETDAGGELTLDHIQPQAQGGSDEIENLALCCSRCNGYKSDYWPQGADALHLWNPRQDAAEKHFLELADGRLYALTDAGALTLARLRLNRPALIANRLQKGRRNEEQQLSIRLRDLLRLSEQLQNQQEVLLAQQFDLLQEQHRLIEILLRLHGLE